MPFQSQAQRAFFRIHLPKLAAEWEKETPKKKLPYHKNENKPLHKYLKEKKQS